MTGDGFGGRCTLLIAHCSLLIAHCSLLIAHCSLLIAHCSLHSELSRDAKACPRGSFDPGNSDELVEQIFQELLATALVRLHFAHLERVSRQFLEPDLAFLDQSADAGVEGAVALPDKFLETPVLADGGGEDRKSVV